MADLKGKVGIVTGGGTGIGRATALAMAKAGAAVVIGNRDAAKGEEVVALIRQAGGRAVFQKTDVSKPADVKALVERAVAEFGRLDVAFNNAGMDGEQVPLHEQDIEKASFLFDVNIKGVFYCMKYEIEQMLKTGGGAIVNTSSIFGLNGYPGWSPVRRHQARRHRHDQGGGAGLRQAEHPGECGRPRPGRDAAAGEGDGRRPAQLRRLRPDGADRPAGRDRRRRGVAAVRRGPVRHRPHAARRWRRLFAVTGDNGQETQGDERCQSNQGCLRR